MASTPPPRIEISGIDDASLKDLYHSVARIDAESHGAERKSDKFYDDAMRFKEDLQDAGSTLYKGSMAVKDADPDHLISKSAAAVSKFMENSAVIMKGLDAVKQLHPFIGVVVLAFQAAIQLEMHRRKNDAKVIALKTEMMNMIASLLDLRTIKDAKVHPIDGMTLEGRMKHSVEEAEQNIRDCSATCEKYINKKFIVKLFDSSRWEQRLAVFPDAFLKRQKEFSFALSIHTAQGIDHVQDALVGISATVKTGSDSASMLLLFSQLKSPKERELQKWIAEQGGPEVVSRDEKLFKELQDKIKDVNDELPGKDKKEPTQTLMEKISKELQEDIDSALARDRQQFDRKFDAVRDNLSETMKTTVHRSTDRIIDAVEGGPHDRIRDTDLHTVWKDMAWRGSVKARHFIVALQDHFLQKYSNEDQEMDNTIRAAEEGISRSVSPALSTASSGAEGLLSAPAAHAPPTATVTDELLAPPSTMVRQVLEVQAAQRELEDRWAVEYITLARVRPILEAFDDDASGWISIREANVLTTNRPANYTVVKWLAFWAAGFRILCARYAKYIHNVRTYTATISANVLPFNRACVDKYMSNSSLDFVDFVVRDTLENFNDYYDENEALMSNFTDYIESEEVRLTKGLESFDWRLDASNTLQIITGSGRIERHILPLISLVLNRHLQVIQLACKQPLDQRELEDAELSVDVLASAIFLRVATLTGNFRAQKLDPTSEFEVAYHGMFRTVYARVSANDGRSGFNFASEYPDWDDNLLDQSDQEILNYDTPVVDDSEIDNRCQHWNAVCDSCGLTIRGARYKCLDCIVPTIEDGVDLCEDCKEKSMSTVVQRQKFNHSSTAHILLKTTCVISLGRQAQVVRKASEKKPNVIELLATSENYLSKQSQKTEKGEGDSADSRDLSLEDVIIPDCLYCRKPISPPCWFCVDCMGNIFICNGCEEKQLEFSRSESAEKTPQQIAHKLRHVMGQVRDVEPEPPRVELDMRLALLEKQFAKHKAVMGDKLESLETAVAKLGEKVEMLGGLEGLLTKLLAKME